MFDITPLNNEESVAYLGIFMWPEQHVCKILDKEITLPKSEYALLYFLMQNPLRPHTKEEIAKGLKQYGLKATPMGVTTTIKRMRKKLEYPIIQTVYAKGYRLWRRSEVKAT